MIHVTCRLTAKNQDEHRNPMLSNRVWATFFIVSYLQKQNTEELTESASWNDSRPLSLSTCSVCFLQERPFSLAVSKLANLLGSFWAKMPWVPTPLARYNTHSMWLHCAIIITTVTTNIITNHHRCNCTYTSNCAMHLHCCNKYLS